MFRYWIVFSLLFVWTSAFSVEVKDLYSAKVALNSQTKKDQNSAIKSALEAVLVKVAGDTSVLSNSAIRNETRNYSKYLTQYNYINEDGINHLVASFDEARVTQLFFQQNIPLWGRLRPLVLFWVVTENGLTRQIVSESEQSLLHNEILNIADQRGLPVVLPLMDLTDSQSIETSDLWGRFIDPVQKASARYSPETIVIIRVSKNNNDPLAAVSSDCDLLCLQSLATIDWHIVNTQSDKVEMGNTYQGSNEVTLVQKAMSDVTAYISKQYVLITEFDNEIIIDVANIDSLTKYVKVSQFLEKLSAISSVQLLEAKGNNRRFKLSIMGSPESIFASLQLNNQLKRYVDPLIGQRLNDVPVFLWGTE